MATELLAVGTTAATSADIVIADGEAVTVCLKDAAGPGISERAHVDIQLKDDDGQYFKIGQLESDDALRAVTLSAPGTYRLSRPADSGSCGAFSAV